MKNTPTSAPRQRIRERRRGQTLHRALDGVSLLAVAAALLLIVTTGLQRGPSTVAAVSPAETPAAAVSVPTPDATSTVGEITVAVTPAALEASPTAESTATPEATATPEPTPTPDKPLIALIAGHRNNDSGAICETGDYAGLQEVEVTTAVTEALKRQLTARGYEVLDLDEFDPQQNGLVADVVLSIHVDSCVEYEGTSGFKVARSAESAIPEVEDQLLACLTEEYGRATRLEVHPGTVTHNMTSYHAFRRVDLHTPSAIIELGFLYHDHDLLTKRQEVMVEGLRRGLECFLKEQE